MATGYAFLSYKADAFNGSIALASDTLKVALLLNTYTPDLDNHAFLDDVNTHEVANGHGYTTGGATLSGRSVTTDTGTDKGIFKCANPSWVADATGFTCRYAVLYKDTGLASSSPLIALWDFGGDQNPVDITFELIVNADGLLDLA